MHRSTIAVLLLLPAILVTGVGGGLIYPEWDFWLFAFWASLAWGIVAAIPVGVGGVMVLEVSLTSGFVRGALFALGGACADATHAILSILGILKLINHVPYMDILIPVLGGGLISLFGVLSIITWMRTPNVSEDAQSAIAATAKARRTAASTKRVVFLKGYMLGFLNPSNIIFFISWAASFVGSRPAENMSVYTSAIPYVLGIFWGCLAMFSLTAYFGARGKKLIPKRSEPRIKLVSGIVMIAFAIGMAAYWLVYRPGSV